MTITVKPAPPPARRSQPPAAGSDRSSPGQDEISSGPLSEPDRTVLYGPGGIGKSTLASLAPDPVFFDLARGTIKLDVHRRMIETWDNLRAAMRDQEYLAKFKTVVVDTITDADQFSQRWVLDNIPHLDKGFKCKYIEQYGFGKGSSLSYENFLNFLADADWNVRQGRNVIFLCHDCTVETTNPNGEDFHRFEPVLQTTKKGTASIRERVFQWADHVIFLGYDLSVDDEGKATGEGTRTLYTSERPTHRAKSRTLDEAIPFESKTDGRIWDLIYGGGQ